MCAVVLGKIKLARIRSNPDPPDKRHLTRRSADRCPVGVVWGPVGGWFVAQRAPNRPKSTPTGPPTTSNCSRMSCSHHHHAEVLAQGLASTLHSPRFPEANEEKSLPQRVAPSVPTETSGRTEESGGGRWRRRQQRALLWRPRSSLPQILEAGLEPAISSLGGRRLIH